MTSLTEDTMLLLFQPRSGTFAGEGTALFHTLAGAVLIDLALSGRISIDDRSTMRGRLVHPTPGPAPEDPLAARAWTRLGRGPADVHALIAEVGPHMRQDTIDRLVAHGDLRVERRRILGLFPGSALIDTGIGRRDTLLAPVRTALVDGLILDARTAALAGLLYASSILPELHQDIPWTGAVHQHGAALQRGEWGDLPVADEVRRSVAAITTNALFLAEWGR